MMAGGIRLISQEQVNALRDENVRLKRRIDRLENEAIMPEQKERQRIRRILVEDGSIRPQDFDTLIEGE